MTEIRLEKGDLGVGKPTKKKRRLAQELQHRRLADISVVVVFLCLSVCPDDSVSCSRPADVSLLDSASYPALRALKYLLLTDANLAEIRPGQEGMC